MQNDTVPIYLFVYCARSCLYYVMGSLSITALASMLVLLLIASCNRSDRFRNLWRLMCIRLTVLILFGGQQVAPSAIIVDWYENQLIVLRYIIQKFQFKYFAAGYKTLSGLAAVFEVWLMSVEGILRGTDLSLTYVA